MQLLTLKNLKNYNLFSTAGNTRIFSAVLISESEIKIKLKTDLSYNTVTLLFNHKDEQVFLAEIVLLKEEKTVLLKGNFNLYENYFVKVAEEKVPVILNPEIGGIIDTSFFYDDNDFGISFSDNEIRFKLWSPPAVKVELLIFDKDLRAVEKEENFYLKNKKPGIWETSINKKYENFFFQYKITAYGKKYTALDPYAKSMAVFDAGSEDKTGKAAIINLKSEKANPLGFKRNYYNFDFIENENDIIVYEINVRDFTIQPGIVDENIAGTFKGFIEKILYLKKLGITHVQLMPVNKAFTQKETDRKYTGKTAKESNYNWGYDPMNFFTPEGRYSTNPYNPAARIYEFKEMVQALHNAGIGVILDVVFNHTYTADTFENVAPGCFYRLNDDYTISGHTGAGASIESRRKQVRKFIVDALKFWVEEYHIDGFRFDLMSFFDKETVKQIRNKVGRTYNPENPNELILHGEAWNFTDLKKDAVTKTDFEHLNIGIFNDTFRDALAGNGHDFGFIHGNSEKTAALATAIVGGIKTYDTDCLAFDKKTFFDPYNLFAKEPGDCLNFMSVHDGLTLWDKINLTVKDKSKKERLRLMKSAYAILFTSQGKIIIHGGDEILRTKPLADFDKEKHRALTSDFIDKEENTVFFHENSYCSPDYTNMFRWDRLTNEYAELANELFDYVKGLIKLRRKTAAFRFKTAKKINRNISFIDEYCTGEFKIHSFNSEKLQKLTITFINGIPGETLYLVGEIHKTEANPTENSYVLHFDENGFAQINFNKKQINNFDLKKWDDSRNLNFKLVRTPGNWDYPHNFYSEFGNNSVSPESINENFELTINLSVKDFKIINSTGYNPKNYIAYIIEQKIKIKNSEYNRILVVHNGKSESLNLNTENLKIPADENITGIGEILFGNIEIEKGEIKIPRKSSAVIAVK